MKKAKDITTRKRFLVIAFSFGLIVLLIDSALHGIHREWGRAVFSLANSIVLIICSTSISLASKIDSRFDRLEEILKEYGRKSKDDDKTNEQTKNSTIL